MVQQTIKFFLDSLVRYPQHKLEWLAVHERAVRIVRTVADKDLTKVHGKRDRKGKGKAKCDTNILPQMWEIANELTASLSQPIGGGEDNINDANLSDGEYEAGGFKAALKIKAVNHLMDYIEGVRIFEKEVRAGEL
jgi:hypothetical protein